MTKDVTRTERMSQVISSVNIYSVKNRIPRSEMGRKIPGEQTRQMMRKGERDARIQGKAQNGEEVYEDRRA